MTTLCFVMPKSPEINNTLCFLASTHRGPTCSVEKYVTHVCIHGLLWYFCDQALLIMYICPYIITNGVHNLSFPTPPLPCPLTLYVFIPFINEWVVTAISDWNRSSVVVLTFDEYASEWRRNSIFGSQLGTAQLCMFSSVSQKCWVKLLLTSHGGWALAEKQPRSISIIAV